MSKRQRRVDIDTANAVARGVNILGVRGAAIAQHYMRHKGVPDTVIHRVLDDCAARRGPSPEQSVSEAIMPSPPEDDQ
jgi:hypothetical protein